MKTLILVFVTLLTQSVVTSAQSTSTAEDWDFTRDDFKKLTSSGKSLHLAKDSTWLPEIFRENLLVTLSETLSNDGPYTNTHGINIEDFFHGHIACKDKLKKETIRKLEGSHNAYKDLLDGILGKWFEPIRDHNLNSFLALVPEINNLSKSGLEDVILSGECSEFVMIYHTYEYSKPTEIKLIGPHDPRRNILTSNRDLIPTSFMPDKDNASSWIRDYQDILQVAFLVDQNGGVHVIRGSVKELAAFVKRPLTKY
jgi:hypothetical protein